MKRATFFLGRYVCIAVILFLLITPQSVIAGQGVNTWTVPGDFATIQEAIDSEDVLPGDTIRVGPGSFAGAYVTKGVHIKGKGQTVIDSGPAGPFGGTFGFYLPAGSDGASFSHLTFTVYLGIYAYPANDVTIEHCRFLDPFQAITNWGGSNWHIHHNTIVNVITVGEVWNEETGATGIGGTPIVIGGREDGAGTVQNNVVSHNTVTGEVLFAPEDDGTEGGIYGIIVAAIPGAEAVSGNLFSHNEIDLVSNDPELREVTAFGLLDWRAPGAVPSSCELIYDNIITLNDLRGPDHQFEVYPEALWDCNTIARNL